MAQIDASKVFVVAVGEADQAFLDGLKLAVQSYLVEWGATQATPFAGAPTNVVTREDLREFIDTHEPEGWTKSDSRVDTAWRQVIELPIGVWCPLCQKPKDKCDNYRHELIMAADAHHLVELPNFIFMRCRNKGTRILIERFAQDVASKLGPP